MVPIGQCVQTVDGIIEFDLGRVPDLSKTTKEVFKCIKPELTIPYSSLRDRIHSLIETHEILEKAEKNRYKNLFIALCKTILVASQILLIAQLSAGGTDREILGGALPLEIMYIPLVCYLYHDSKKKIEKIEKRAPNYSPTPCFEYDMYGAVIIPMVGGGLCMPLIEASSKISRLKKILNGQKEEIAKDLAAAYSFYRYQSEPLSRELKQRITLLKQCVIRKIQGQKSSGESAADEDMSALGYFQIASEELDRVILFFSKLRPITEPSVEIELESQPAQGLFHPLLGKPNENFFS